MVIRKGNSSEKSDRHYPPAYYRYRKKHATISILLTDSTKRALDSSRGVKSYAQFIKSLLSADGSFFQLEKLKRENNEALVEIRKTKLELAEARAELNNSEHLRYWCKLCGRRFVTRTACILHRQEDHPGRKNIIQQF
jgi:hypothetical protein